jgi:hypothetical protein
MGKFNAVDYFWKNALSIEPLLSLENPNGPFSLTQANKNNNSGRLSWVLVTHSKNIMQVIVRGLELEMNKLMVKIKTNKLIS